MKFIGHMYAKLTQFFEYFLKDQALLIVMLINFKLIAYMYCYFIEPTYSVYAQLIMHVAIGFLILCKYRRVSYYYTLSFYLTYSSYIFFTLQIFKALYQYISHYQNSNLTLYNVEAILLNYAQLDPIYCTLCLLSIVPTLIVVCAIVKQFKRPQATHGSAQLMSQNELKNINQTQGIPIGLMTSFNAKQPLHDQMKTLSKVCQGKLLRLNPDHVLVIAPSGSGKGVGLVIPTLLDYEGSVIVTDVKAAENYHVTAVRRQQMGRIVYAFDPYCLTYTQSCSINILDALDPESDYFIEHVSEIVSILCPLPMHDSGNARFFIEQASSLIQCFILYVIAHPDVDEKDKNLMQVYKFLSLSPSELHKFLQRLTEEDFCDFIPARLAANLLSPGQEEFGSTLSTARTALRFLDTPIMHHLTATTTIDIHAIISNQADLFICIPSEALDAKKRMIQLLLSTIFLHLRKTKTKPNPPLLFLIDEMPFLGYIKQLEQILLIGRGYGIKIMAIAQTIDSLKQVYPQSWQTMLASNLSLFFGISDIQTAEYVSRMLGKQTIEVQSTNKSYNAAQGAHSLARSTNLNTTSRSLLTPEETMCLPAHLLLGFLRAHKPFLLEKICYYQDKRWKGKFDKNPLEF